MHTNNQQTGRRRVSYRTRFVASLLFLVSIVPVACTSSDAGSATPILLFTGTGTSRGDVASVETILNDKHLKYTTANTHQLNGMNEPQLASYRLLVVPGGNFIDMSKALTARTTANIHNAVQGGLNYLGICAGAFLAGHARYNSLSLASVQFGFYSASSRGIRKAAVAVSVVNAPSIEHYWEDGPQLTGWGDVVGKYPDGKPAVVEGESGKGWVILSGVHPEAPESWRRGMNFTMPASVANAYAKELVDAALNRTVLPHY